jgi:hypothetical protein
MRGFQDPPNGARPRVWWHWMNGNITPEGLTLDLEWMHRAGVGGVTIFEGAIDTPQVVPQRLIFMTPEWKQAFSHAVATAHGLGMEVAIASSPGWSETGGPWVPAAEGMKKMVWSATRVEGGRPVAVALPHPPQVDGTFQNFQRRRADGQVAVLPQFYADAAVVAYRIPAGDRTQAELDPQVTASGGRANVPGLSDGDVDTVALDLPAGAPGEGAWVQFDYGRPQTIQAVTLATLDDHGPPDMIKSPATELVEVGDDGVHFRTVAEIPPSNAPQRTAAFSAVTARYFRVRFTRPSPARPGGDHHITELELSSGARVNEFEKRAGYASAPDFYRIPDPKVAPEFVVPQADVLDLTGRMKPDGRLDWTPPAGRWMVLRIGSSLTGHQNSPAPAEATGLEVDKLNREFVKNYLDAYLKMYSDTVGAERMGSAGIAFLLSDSVEVGEQNWTDNLLSEFLARRGYDAHPWLPALTGVVIKSPAETDRFLWDFRRTIAQLFAESHYGEIAEELHRHGMGYYAEALESHRPSLGDDMEMRSKTDIPMGAMWTYAESTGPDVDFFADLRGAASVAHIYGQNLVGAESMTSNGPAWSFSPNRLKRIADLEFALGVNRFEIHESAHQPLAEMAPGMTLGPYGLWFNRNETWAEEARPWIDYLARSSFLLQQGHFCGDVAYFYGEEGPLTAVFGWEAQRDAPEGYGFDFVNSDVLLHQMTYKDGRLVTPGGTSYRILYLGGNSRRMTLAVLRQLESLVEQGAVVVGAKPIDSPSLSDDEKEFHNLADELWGGAAAQSGSVRRVGKGRVYTGMTANQVLAALDVARDFEYTRPEADAALMFVHRRLEDGDIYFVDNRKDRTESVDATFRVEGRTPELWDAATGESKPVSYRIAEGRTTIPLRLDPFGAIFVVFRAPATATSRQLPEPAVARVAGLDEALNENWSVSFQPGRGAPEQVEFDRLGSWSDNSMEGVKYFSGTATYAKTVEVPASGFRPGAHLWLDLGDVEDVAEVAVNGKPLGILWKAPFTVDVTGALRPGSNQVTIKVTNLWVNRLIGDQQSDAEKKYTFTDFKPYKADSPLLRSGLLGPLQLLSVAAQ